MLGHMYTLHYCLNFLFNLKLFPNDSFIKKNKISKVEIEDTICKQMYCKNIVCEVYSLKPTNLEGYISDQYRYPVTQIMSGLFFACLKLCASLTSNSLFSKILL